MNKTQLIETLAERTQQSKSQSAVWVDALVDSFQQALAVGDSIRINGFGSFTVTKRAARIGNNPATGEAIAIPAKKGVKFKPGKALTESVAKAK